MRHQQNKLLQLNTGAKSKTVFMRMQLSSLIRAGKLTTTPKRAKVLKAFADTFFSTLLSFDAKYGEAVGKIVIETLLPKYREEKRTSGFTTSYKLGFRVGDAAAKTMLKLA